jgi:molybdopterin-guanine dinucleotide biosynthesis protein A
LAARNVTGLILAGGAGKRMGGADKGLLDFQGRPLIAHVIERLTPQVDRLLISANRNLDAYRAFGHPVLTDLADEHFGRLGPLAGIQAGLLACETPWMIVCPCDCPQLPDDLVSRLLSAAETQGAALAVAATSTGMQPAFQLCRRELLPALEKTLAAGERKVGAWCRAQGAVEVTFPDPDAFRNLNTPEELAFRPV